MTEIYQDGRHSESLSHSEHRRRFPGENKPKRDCNIDMLVHGLFEEQSTRSPDAVAVVHGGQHITYSELDCRANRLARLLAGLGVGPDKLVGLYVERGLDMVTSLLGVLKAGGAYVPLDPNYPIERLRYIVADAAPHLILTQGKLRRGFSISSTVLELESMQQQVLGYDDKKVKSEELGLTSQNLVYAIYTSGSTGTPKGIAMSHRSMVNLIDWHQENLGSCEGKAVLQFAALSFDVAFQETFSTLCGGGTLVIVDEWVRRDAGMLLRVLAERSVQRLFVPPLMLQSLAECGKTESAVPCLQDIIAAGEQLRITREISSFFQQHNGCRLHNHYGPTETHVVTALTLSGETDRWPMFPTIGHPIANATVHLLDWQYRAVASGEIGEICIGGVAVARGYLGRTQMTAERFIADPFSADSRGRMYRTGDLGRWRADGELEYLGRNDDQVKIRGFRIELGEIEAQLLQHPEVGEAALMAHEAAGEKRLVAYIVPRANMALHSALSAAVLRAHLRAVLPEYMLPSAFVTLNRLPLTPNGKLDRLALPAPDLDAYATQEYEVPRGELEERLAAIWQDLLRVERVGRRDNFFELGGHSLLIARVLIQLRSHGLYCDPQKFYARPVLADLAETLGQDSGIRVDQPPNLIPPGCAEISPEMLPLVKLTRSHIQEIVATVPGGAANIQDIYPLAPLQEGILFHHLMDERRGDTYVLPILLSISSRGDLEALTESLQEIVDRHDVLRSAVLWDRLPQPIQVVYRHATLSVEELPLDPEPLSLLREQMRPQVQRLDLHRAPLMHLRVAASAREGQCYALLQLHHLICDHESLDMMLEELKKCLAGRSNELPASMPYRYHVARALMYSRTNDMEDFFHRKLKDIDSPTAPFGLLDVHGDGSRIEEASEELEATLTRRVRLQAMRLGVSAATLFHASWALVVARTSGRDDVVFGSLLSGRLHAANTQQMLGIFINTLPLRLKLKNATATEFVKQTHREVVDLLRHEQASLAVAQRCSGITGSAPLFSSLLNFFHSGIFIQNEQFALSTEVQILSLQERTNYPISLSVDDQDDKFVLTAHTDRSIDPRRVLNYISTATEALLVALETVSETPVLALPVLSEDEHRQVIEGFNEARRESLHVESIHECFEKQVAHAADRTALVYEQETLSYGELNRSANRLSRRLRQLGVSAESRVGLCVERSIQMVVGILAILKSGGAYVPLDPSYPVDRLKYMLDDAGLEVLLIQDHLRQLLPGTSVKMLTFESADSKPENKDVESNPEPADPGLSSRTLAYIIYTSGSTGRPKGVMVEHGSVINLIAGHMHNCALSADDRVLQFAAYGFDASIEEIFPPLSVGAVVVLRPRGMTIADARFSRLLKCESVTVAELPTAFWHQWAQQREPYSEDELPRIVVVGGEKAERRHLDRWRSSSSGRQSQWLNTYGPTEATVYATALLVCGDAELRAGDISLGRPSANCQIYLLSAHLQPVPIGVCGEIYIGGVGVARGYLGRPELTAQRFVPDPFGCAPGARLYRTGDLGKWRPDGTLEYLGRNDSQVKYRGFRIELGEIEAQLVRHAQVREAVVVARDNGSGEKRLVAYVIPCDGTPSAETLRRYLEAAVPEFMVPSAFVLLERLPLTPNGKLDTVALPAPGSGAYASRQYEAPQGEVEEVLAELWQSLLHVERVGRQDNFFDLGGHSLLAMQLLVRVRASLCVDMPMSVLFKLPTIKDLATRVDELRHDRLMDEIAQGGSEMDELLEMVSSMSDLNARELIQKMKAPLGPNRRH